VEKVQALLTVIDNIERIADAMLRPGPFGSYNVVFIVLSHENNKLSFFHLYFPPFSDKPLSDIMLKTTTRITPIIVLAACKWGASLFLGRIFLLLAEGPIVPRMLL
jgi:hypothetical protein